MPGDLPEYVEVDMLKVEIDQIVHLSDLALPRKIIALTQGEDHDLPVVAVHTPKKKRLLPLKCLPLETKTKIKLKSQTKINSSSLRQNGAALLLSPLSPCIVNEQITLIVGLGNLVRNMSILGTMQGLISLRNWLNNQANNSSSKQSFTAYSKITFCEQTASLSDSNYLYESQGQAVAALAHFYKIPPEAILIAHDELDIPPGSVKLKFSGGHGGHNGLRDIISQLAAIILQDCG